MPETTIRLSGLNELDAEELLEAVGPTVELQRPEVQEGALAEPATITAVVALTSALMPVVALWLSKGRRSYLRKQTFKITHPDGRVEERTLEVRASSQDAATAEILAELEKWIQPPGTSLGR